MSLRNYRSSRRLRFPVASLALFAVLAQVASAANSTWVSTGVTGPLWSNADNWNFSGVPGAVGGIASVDVATFNSSLGLFGTSTNPVAIDAGRNVAGLHFTGTPGSYVVGAVDGPALVLSSGGSIQLLNSVSISTTAVRIDAPLLMATGSYSLINNSVQAGNSLTFNGPISALGAGEHTLTLGNVVQFGVTSNVNNNNNSINAPISNGGADVLRLNKTGLANWTLSANNTYTGPTTVRGGVTNTNVQLGNLRIAGLNGRLSATSALDVAGLGALLNGDVTAANNNAVTNRISPAASLRLGSPNFGGGVYTQFAPAAGASHTQTLASLHADVGYNLLNASGATGTNSVSFSGTYTRSPGAFVNFGTATGFSISFGQAPAGSAVVGEGADAILVGSALSSANFIAAPAAGAPLAIATYASTPNWTTGKNMDVVGSPNLDSSLAANSLRFNAASAQTLTLASGVTLNLTSGGLLNGSGKAGNATTIIGGTLTGSPSGELSVAHFGSGTLTLQTTVADNGGPTALTRVGSGTVVLAGENTYSGGTYLNMGTLQVRTGSALGTGPVRIQGHSSQLNLNNTLNPSGFTLPNDVTVNYAAGVGGQGLIHSSAGTYTLAGTLTVNALPINGGLFGGSGVVQLSGPIVAPFGVGGRSGTIRISGTPTTQALSSYPLIFNNGSTLQVGAENGILTTAVLDNNQGAGGTFDLNGFNQQLAGLTNSGGGGGTLHNTAGGEVRTLTVNVADGLSYTTNAALGGTVANNQAAFALTKIGAGTQILNGTSTYTGPTQLNGGRLVVGTTAGSTAQLAAGSAVTVASGAVLAGTGTINGPLTLQGGAILQPGHNSLHPLTLAGSSVSLSEGSVIDFGAMSQAGGSVSNELRIVSPDALATSGSAGAIEVRGDITALTAGVYSLIDYDGSVGGVGFPAFTPAFVTGPRLNAQLLNNSGDGRVELLVTGDTPRWSGAGSSEWSTAALSVKNWSLLAGGTPTDYFSADVVRFDDTAVRSTVDISVADVTPNGVVFDNSSLNYTLQGTRGLTGSVTLVKSGGGSLTIANPNKHTGGLRIDGGTVLLAAGGLLAAPTAPVVLNAGVLDLGGTTQYSGPVTIVAPAEVRNGTLLGTAYTINTAGSDTTLSGLSGPSAPLTKTGAGTLTLGTGNSYTGNTTVSEGILRIGAFNAVSPLTRVALATNTTLDLNGYDLTIDALNATNAFSLITNNGEGEGVDTLTSLFTTSPIAALVNDGPSRKVRLTIGTFNADNGPINTSNAYSGGTVLLGQQGANTHGTRLIPKAGTLADVQNGMVSEIFSGPYGSGPITLGLAPTDRVQLYFNLTTAYLQVYNELIFNTELGTDTAGALRVESEGSEFYGRLVANQANVSFRANNQLSGSVPEANATIFGQITTGVNPAAGLRLYAPGFAYAVNLANTSARPNDYTGNTTIEGGRLRLQAAEQIPHGTGKGSVVLSGTGLLDLNGFSETVNALAGTGGVIDATAGQSLLTIGAGDGTGSYAGVLRNNGGALSLAKTGAGVQTFSGNNTYSGSTTLSGGTLAITRAAGALPDTTALTIDNDATLNLGTSAEVLGAVTLNSGSIVATSGSLLGTSYDLKAGLVSAALAGSSGVMKTGPGLLVLTGANTYEGATSVQAGVLRIDGNQSGAIGAVTVAAGATLGGSGSLGGSVNVAASGTLAPGGDFPGTLAAPSITLDAGAGLALDLQAEASGTPNDALSVAGQLSVGGASLNLSVTGTPGANVYVLATYGSLSGTFAQVTGLPAGYTLDYAYEGNKIALTRTVMQTPYSIWIDSFAGLDAERRAMTADPDGDGAMNLAEFALAGDPVSASTQGRLYAKTATLGGAPAFTATLAVRAGAVFGGSPQATSEPVDGLVYRIQASTDLANWTTQVVTEVVGADALALQTGLPALPTGWTYRSFRVAGSLGAGTRFFLRAVVEVE